MGVPPARAEPRAGGGYRTYDENDLKLLRQIRTLQDFGFDLEETRPFVECLRAGHPEGDSCPASLQVYRRKLDELDALIGELRAVRTRIGEQPARAESARRGSLPVRAKPGTGGGPAAEAAVPGGPEPMCELGGELR